MHHNPTKAELQAENTLLRKHNSATQLANVINNFIRWFGICVIAYFAFRSIDALSGENTTADIGIKLFADVRLSEVFAYLFGGGGVIYGLRQSSLRRNTVERLQGRIKHFEQQHDPNRTSSELTPRGEAHPNDK